MQHGFFNNKLHKYPLVKLYLNDIQFSLSASENKQPACSFDFSIFSKSQFSR
jgi:hypothetical protein